MSFKTESKLSASVADFSGVSVLTSIYSAFIILSFRDFFFFVPNFSRPYPVIAFVQIFTTLGWIALIILPPYVLTNWSRLGRLAPALLLTGALIWPISTLMIKALYLTFYGNPFVGYLGEHPLFLLMEYGIPVMYLYILKEKRYQI